MKYAALSLIMVITLMGCNQNTQSDMIATDVIPLESQTLTDTQVDSRLTADNIESKAVEAGLSESETTTLKTLFTAFRTMRETRRADRPETSLRELWKTAFLAEEYDAQSLNKEMEQRKEQRKQHLNEWVSLLNSIVADLSESERQHILVFLESHAPRPPKGERPPRPRPPRMEQPGSYGDGSMDCSRHHRPHNPGMRHLFGVLATLRTMELDAQQIATIEAAVELFFAHIPEPQPRPPFHHALVREAFEQGKISQTFLDANEQDRATHHALIGPLVEDLFTTIHDTLTTEQRETLITMLEERAKQNPGHRGPRNR